MQFTFQEYQKHNSNLKVENAEMNNVVYLYKCENSTCVVKGKINSITLDSCKKTSIVFDSLVSSLEFINCQSVQTQVFITFLICLMFVLLNTHSRLSEYGLTEAIIRNKKK